jgi:uncharacterized protein YjbI with pentapeptide repeats
MRKSHLCLVILAAFCFLSVVCTGQAEAQIYRWITANGTLAFGQYPPTSGEYRSLERLPEVGERIAVENVETTLAQETRAERALSEEESQQNSLSAAAFPGIVATDLPRVFLGATVLQGVPGDELSLAEEGAGVRLRTGYLSQVMLADAELARANLQEASLAQAYLGEADLSEADLRGAYLMGASLQGATLQGASLQGANLQGADLRAADLQGANLHGANLLGAHVQGANFTGADLQGADLTYTIGLTREQLALAYIDENTQLPDGF